MPGSSAANGCTHFPLLNGVTQAPNYMGAPRRADHAPIGAVHRIVVHVLMHVVGEGGEGSRDASAKESEQLKVRGRLAQQQSQDQPFGDATQLAEVPGREAGGHGDHGHQEAAGERGSY